jgi:hypothetical protein
MPTQKKVGKLGFNLAFKKIKIVLTHGVSYFYGIIQEVLRRIMIREAKYV